MLEWKLALLTRKPQISLGWFNFKTFYESTLSALHDTCQCIIRLSHLLFLLLSVILFLLPHSLSLSLKAQNFFTFLPYTTYVFFQIQPIPSSLATPLLSIQLSTTFVIGSTLFSLSMPFLQILMIRMLYVAYSAVGKGVPEHECNCSVQIY
ncbi:hypothetical protein RJT34_26392 [Clitoria ternatea]|uniref:Uncharacterized protein n=1 Tax=Clitoria ternatea TaxID=43366 RepID=A0AAN9F940_CLITE